MEKTEQKFLAIAAHADDFELFASSLCELGTVKVVVVTEPDLVRSDELDKASEVLGYEYVTMRFLDGYLYLYDFRDRLRRIINLETPDVLVTHDPWKLYQLHPDHRATGYQTLDAITLLRVHNQHVPSRVLLWNTDLADTQYPVNYFKKRAALQCYQSQIVSKAPPDLSEYFHELNLNEVYG